MFKYKILLFFKNTIVKGVNIIIYIVKKKKIRFQNLKNLPEGDIINFFFF